MRTIRQATDTDWPNIWPIIHAVCAESDTFVFAADISEDEARAIWMLPPPSVCYVAVDGGEVAGTFQMKPNLPGRGAHVANASFMVAPGIRGVGVGRAMGKFALEEARRCGYQAMQFNAVVSTNHAAVALWRSLGFSIIGSIPQGYQHRSQGLVDLYIMHRFLAQE